MKLYYIWDAYCGWCYGFDKVFSTFMKDHPDLDLEMISGGLFTGGHEKTSRQLGRYDVMNEEIAKRYGVVFGQPFKASFDQDLIIDSLHPAQAFGVLRQYLTQDQVPDLAYQMQKAFYQEGKILSDIATYEPILAGFDLDPMLVLPEIAHAWQSRTPHPDFMRARELGVTTYPTLILEKDGHYVDLRGQSETLEDLERNYHLFLNSQKNNNN